VYPILLITSHCLVFVEYDTPTHSGTASQVLIHSSGEASVSVVYKVL
jgi:hypothetical protein